MPSTRLPYWMTAADRAALASAIAELRGSAALVPALRSSLEAVALELGVVEARDQVWPIGSDVYRQGTGLAPDVLPVRMSEEERTAVLTIASLDPGVRASLSGERGRRQA